MTKEEAREKYITKLNDQIAMIEPSSIQAHIDDGSLEKWLWDWRIETAAISFALYVILRRAQE